MEPGAVSRVVAQLHRKIQDPTPGKCSMVPWTDIEKRLTRSELYLAKEAWKTIQRVPERGPQAGVIEMPDNARARLRRNLGVWQTGTKPTEA